MRRVENVKLRMLNKLNEAFSGSYKKSILSIVRIAMRTPSKVKGTVTCDLVGRVFGPWREDGDRQC